MSMTSGFKFLISVKSIRHALMSMVMMRMHLKAPGAAAADASASCTVLLSRQLWMPPSVALAGYHQLESLQLLARCDPGLHPEHLELGLHQSDRD